MIELCVTPATATPTGGPGGAVWRRETEHSYGTGVHKLSLPIFQKHTQSECISAHQLVLDAPRVTLIQWTPSNLTTLGTNLSVLIREVVAIQGLNCITKLVLQNLGGVHCIISVTLDICTSVSPGCPQGYTDIISVTLENSPVLELSILNSMQNWCVFLVLTCFGGKGLRIFIKTVAATTIKA